METKNILPMCGLGATKLMIPTMGAGADGHSEIYLGPGEYHLQIIATGDPPDELSSYGYTPEWYHSDYDLIVTDINQAELIVVQNTPVRRINFCRQNLKW